MSKYKLINSVTKIETLCDKVTIDGFDYYVSDNPKGGKYIIWLGKTVEHFPKQGTPQLTYGTTIISTLYSGGHAKDWKEIVATNNPNIDCPKVIDEAELRDMLFVLDGQKVYTAYMNDHNSETALGGFLRGCKHGYNKSQETHPFSEEDMIEFSEWLDRNTYVFDGSPTLSKNGKSIGIAKDKLYCRVDYTLSDNNCGYTTKELLQLWKEQKPKIVYYE